MPKFTAEPYDVEGTHSFFHSRKGFEHLRARRRGELLTVVSGPERDAINHFRLRRVTKQWWELEVPTSGGRWEQVGLRANRMEIFSALLTDYPWLLAPRE